MKLSRRGKSARRGRHTKRAGKHLRYRGKKVSGSKRYHREHKRTHKRGRRFHRGGDLTVQDAQAAADQAGMTPEKLCSKIKQVMGNWVEVNTSTMRGLNGFRANIPDVYLKCKKTFRNTIGKFSVNLKVTNLPVISIEFLSTDEFSDMSVKVTDLDQFPPSVFNLPENKGVLDCIKGIIDEKLSNIIESATTTTPTE